MCLFPVLLCRLVLSWTCSALWLHYQTTHTHTPARDPSPHFVITHTTMQYSASLFYLVQWYALKKKMEQLTWAHGLGLLQLIVMPSPCQIVRYNSHICIIFRYCSLCYLCFFSCQSLCQAGSCLDLLGVCLEDSGLHRVWISVLPRTFQQTAMPGPSSISCLWSTPTCSSSLHF